MKNLKIALSVFALIFATSASTFAQETANVNIGAVVLADITIASVTDVSFGNIQDTGSPILDPNGTNSAVGDAASIGGFVITAATSTALLVSWDQATVTLGDGTNTMTYTPDVDAFTSNTPASALDITSGVATNTTTDGSSGELHIFIGGDLGTLSSQASGTYSSSDSGNNGSGDLEFTVNYQ